MINFYSREILQPDKRLLTTVADIGSQIGQFIERTRVEGALQEGAQLIRGVLDNVADGIITIDEGGLIEIFNRAAQRLFGYPLAERGMRGAKRRRRCAVLFFHSIMIPARRMTCAQRSRFSLSHAADCAGSSPVTV